jgi:low temperature requirement protein LtrA
VSFLVRYYIDKINIYFITYFLVLLGVCFGWQGLEMLIYHEIQPRTVDNIIAIILSISLWMHLRIWVDKRLKEDYKIED